MLSLRWFPAQNKPVWNMFGENYKAIRFAWLTTGIDTESPVCCAIGLDHFDKGGHHATWFPDGKRISLNLILDHEPFRFASVNWDGSDIRYIFDTVRGSGHPTVHPAGYIMTDTYNAEWDFPVYGDGTIPLRWVNIKTGREQVAVRINTQQPCADGTLRVDPHPAWDRTWRYLAFNAYVGGTRRVFVADFKSYL
jgi:hypothetical protein